VKISAFRISIKQSKVMAIESKVAFGRHPRSPRNVLNPDSLKKRFMWWIRIALWDRLVGRLDSDSHGAIYIFLKNYINKNMFQKKSKLFVDVE
jgi:hypothetical protein